jgi:hypothetical protein
VDTYFALESGRVDFLSVARVARPGRRLALGVATLLPMRLHGVVAEIGSGRRWLERPRRLHLHQGANEIRGRRIREYDAKSSVGSYRRTSAL